MNGKLERKEKSMAAMQRFFQKSNSSETIKKFYETRLSEGQSFNTCMNYARYAQRFEDYLVSKGISYGDVKKRDVNEFINQLNIDENGETRKVSDSYKASAFSALKNFLDYLSDEDVNIIGRNPMVKMKRPPIKDRKKQVFLEQEEVKNLFQMEFSNITGLRDELILRVLLTTGIRVSALIDLNVENYNGKEIEVVDKGDKVYTKLLDEKTIEMMNLWLEERDGKVGPEVKAIFINNRGDRLSVRTVERMVKKYTSQCGHTVTPHKLRATYATQLYRETKDIVYVQEQMIHSDIRTTQRYTVAEGDSKNAVDIMSKMML